MIMDVHILGIGTAVPEYEIEQADAAQQASQLCCATLQQQQLMKILYRRSGVMKRHSVVLTSSTNGQPAEQSFYRQSKFHPNGPTTADRMEMYDSFAAPLAIEAARQSLRDAEVKHSEVTHLVTVSCSGFSAPGVDLAIIRELRLQPNTSRTHIGFMGCHGALNGLRVAKAFAVSRPGSCVLLCAVELCTLHHQYGWQPEQIVANALFADGAAAVVIQASDDHPKDALSVVGLGSTVLPDSSHLMRWRIEDHGFQMNLSPQVPDLISRALRPWLQRWLSEHKLDIDDIGSWAIHPGGPRIIEACAQTIASKTDCISDSLGVLAEYGNMSSPTILFILDRLRTRGAPRPYLALAFGPGIAVEAALLK
jgi:predicted naringenin-chalcone synthase